MLSGLRYYVDWIRYATRIFYRSNTVSNTFKLWSTQHFCMITPSMPFSMEHLLSPPCQRHLTALTCSFVFSWRHACCTTSHCLHNTSDPCLFFARRFLVGFVRVCVFSQPAVFEDGTQNVVICSARLAINSVFEHVR